MKHTKIVATIGPASESREVLRQMIEAGLNVVRLNFSHGEYEWHKTIIDTVRGLSEELGRPIAILADIQGPRIRLHVTQELKVMQGDTLIVSDIAYQKSLAPEACEKAIFLDQPHMSDDIALGHLLLIEDGLLQLRVVSKEAGILHTEVLNDGLIKSRKGVNLPDSKINLPVLTEKDKRDLRFVVTEGVDYIGLSFVGSAEDIAWVREEMHKAMPGVSDGELPKIVSKIERKEAMKNLDAIIEVTDAVMVARGDLGIEMPESEVVLLQKEIIAKSMKRAKPVIVATQMMKSMTENPRPTRAEVSDVTNAVIDHADAVMLSEESAMGKYPVETIAMMTEILQKTEQSPFDDVREAMPTQTDSSAYSALVRSIYELTLSFEAKAVLLLSMSGLTARLMSHFRPDAHLFAATNVRKTWNQLALVWGVDAYLFEGDNDLDTFTDRLAQSAKADGRLASGDKIVVCRGKSADAELQLVGMKEVA
ncbi:MAG: pyruvate kinase [Candidatus Moranbacteria bacterium]|nr:pyruvate kinase [Candidatus Moranbacteria bacterium]